MNIHLDDAVRSAIDSLYNLSLLSQVEASGTKPELTKDLRDVIRLERLLLSDYCKGKVDVKLSQHAVERRVDSLHKQLMRDFATREDCIDLEDMRSKFDSLLLA